MQNEKPEIVNAKITDTMLGMEHGCLTAFLTLESDKLTVCSGGYVLDHWDRKPGEYSSLDGFGAIIELMETVGVEQWEDLKGQYVRIMFDTTNCGEEVLKIGNLILDKWFSWKEYFAEAKEKKTKEC